MIPTSAFGHGLSQQPDQPLEQGIGPGVNVYRPSLRHRFWGWLGFGQHSTLDMSDLEEGPGRLTWAAPGTFAIDATTELDPLDRLRVLISGRVTTQIRVKTDVLVGKSVGRSVFSVCRPGGDL